MILVGKIRVFQPRSKCWRWMEYLADRGEMTPGTYCLGPGTGADAYRVKPTRFYAPTGFGALWWRRVDIVGNCLIDGIPHFVASDGEYFTHVWGWKRWYHFHGYKAYKPQVGEMLMVPKPGGQNWQSDADWKVVMCTGVRDFTIEATTEDWKETREVFYRRVVCVFPELGGEKRWTSLFMAD